jgi:hypothetical protein
MEHGHEGKHHHHQHGFHHKFDDVEKWVAKFERADRDEYQKPAEVL